MIGQGQRGKHHGYGTGGGDCARYLELINVRADECELFGCETELPSLEQVGGVDLHEGSFTIDQLPDGGCTKQRLVEVLIQYVTGTKSIRTDTRECGGCQQGAGQFRSNVTFQKCTTKVGEDSLAEQAEVGGCNTAAGHRGNHVDFIKHGLRLIASGQPGIFQPFEYAVGQRGRTCTTAGKSHDQQGVAIALFVHAGQARLAVKVHQRRIVGVALQAGAAGEQYADQSEARQCAERIFHAITWFYSGLCVQQAGVWYSGAAPCRFWVSGSGFEQQRPQPAQVKPVSDLLSRCNPGVEAGCHFLP